MLLSSWQNTDAIIVLLTLPFYACIFFRDNYIDEGFAVTRNQDVADLSKSTWYDVLIHDFWGQDLWPTDGIHWTHKSYRPLITYSFRLSYCLFPDDPLPSLRFINCLIHTLTCLVVKRCWFFRHNVFAAYLFAVHPVHVENIVYLVGRADSAATLFFVLGADSENFLRVAVCTVLSGLCKETGFTLPILVAFLCLVQKKWFRGIGFLGLFLVVFALRSAYVQGTHADFGYVDTPVRYQDDIQVRFWSYLLHHQIYGQLLIFPWNLSWDYSYDSLPLLFQKQWDLRVMGILSAYAFLVGMFFRVIPRRTPEVEGDVLKRRRARKYGDLLYNCSTPSSSTASAAESGGEGDGSSTAAEGTNTPPLLTANQQVALMVQNENIVTDYFAAAMIVVPFVPASNLFFLVGTTIGERLLYPITVGSCLLVVRLLSPENLAPLLLRRILTATLGRGLPQRIANSGEGRRPVKPTSHVVGHSVSVLCFAKVVYLVYFMYVAYIRTTHWRSKEVLFEKDAKASKWQPRSAKVLHQFAVLLQARGDHDLALDYYQKALDVFDDNAMSDYCMARIHLEKGDCESGLKIFIKINNGHGIGFGDHNQFLLNNDFGYALSCVGAYDEAVPILEEALQLMNPNFAYVYNSLALGIFHLATSSPDKLPQGGQTGLQRVVDLLQQALSLHPDEFTLWFNLGVVLLKGNVVQEAQNSFVEAEKKVKTVFEYQTLVDAVQKMKDGKHQELQLLWLKVPVAKG
ncbi:unnamed protein product [Amoebophrya sp. A120]|nr:unnamed protein product [Amoebophrya sp. A120]|eukprot:GSA120T00003683001.1